MRKAIETEGWQWPADFYLDLHSLWIEAEDLYDYYATLYDWVPEGRLSPVLDLEGDGIPGVEDAEARADYFVDDFMGGAVPVWTRLDTPDGLWGVRATGKRDVREIAITNNIGGVIYHSDARDEEARAFAARLKGEEPAPGPGKPEVDHYRCCVNMIDRHAFLHRGKGYKPHEIAQDPRFRHWADGFLNGGTSRRKPGGGDE